MRSKGRSRFIALCVAPAAILFFIFMVMPTFNVFRMSLFERGAYSPTETFVGLNNFKVLFKDTKFIVSMQNTILLIVTVTIVTFFFAIVFAAILTREKIRGQNFFRHLQAGQRNAQQHFFPVCRPGYHGALEGPAHGNRQRYHRYGVAGHRLLYGHVHGLHVRRSRGPV